MKKRKTVAKVVTVSALGRNGKGVTVPHWCLARALSMLGLELEHVYLAPESAVVALGLSKLLERPDTKLRYRDALRRVARLMAAAEIGVVVSRPH